MVSAVPIIVRRCAISLKSIVAGSWSRRSRRWLMKERFHKNVSAQAMKILGVRGDKPAPWTV